MFKISEKKIWKKYSFFGAHFWHENDIIADFFFQKWEIGVLNGLQLEADPDPLRIVAYIGYLYVLISKRVIMIAAIFVFFLLLW